MYDRVGESGFFGELIIVVSYGHTVWKLKISKLSGYQAYTLNDFWC